MALVPYLTVRGEVSWLAKPGQVRARVTAKVEERESWQINRWTHPLDSPRIENRLALERTLMAWIRTCTSLIAFGFTIYQFFLLSIDERAASSRADR